jgi:CheY-like chemotaxis protein
MHLGRAWPFEHELAVESCGEWPEVLEKLRTTRFAVIVLDWHLPGIEGAELLRRVRGQGVRVPVVIVSGMERTDIPDDLAALSAAFLNKDAMNADTLHAAIAESLRLLGLSKAE